MHYVCEKKKNKSGIVSVQIIDKSSGKYKMVKTIGSSNDATEIDILYNQGLDYIEHYQGQQIFDFSTRDFKKTIKQSIQKIYIDGIHLLLGKIYTEIGFNEICDDLLKQLVLVWLSHPASKLMTTHNLQRYFSVDINEDRIYRYLARSIQITRKNFSKLATTIPGRFLEVLLMLFFTMLRLSTFK
ncbi:hypothetical protein FH5T_15860 [Draconibacterium orientale]|uniref:Transposase DDE domain-containing protein n=1 Tax=Draconibacterium orientale TaxID=1168034 RepID=A0ABM5QF36_9BACT|nr:hypothetical protein FH5T_15860 [Draconibacterium orientale]